jgi:hypothetical protein
MNKSISHSEMPSVLGDCCVLRMQARGGYESEQRVSAKPATSAALALALQPVQRAGSV